MEEILNVLKDDLIRRNRLDLNTYISPERLVFVCNSKYLFMYIVQIAKSAIEISENTDIPVSFCFFAGGGGLKSMKYSSHNVFTLQLHLQGVLLLDEYVDYPLPVNTWMPYNYCAIPRLFGETNGGFVSSLLQLIC